MCSPNRVPQCEANETGYGKLGYGQMKQRHNILQFPRIRAESLSEITKPTPCFPR